MTWNTFLALTSVFRANQDCDKLFDAFGIHLEQLNDYLNVTK